MELQRLGHEIAFVSFDDRSSEMLREAGFTVFSLSDEPIPEDVSDAIIDAAALRYGLSDLNFWFSHERAAFGLCNSAVLRSKLLRALSLTSRACAEWAPTGNAVLIQELGGFLSVVGSYFAARHHGLDNWFIEPAFFRGRLFFLKNSFAALRLQVEVDTPVSGEVLDYLAQTLKSGEIVVPKKDHHQYTTAFRKVVNFRNLRRLAEKLIDKYIHGKRHEFGYIFRHVAVHASMLLNSFRMKGHYTPLAGARKFIYYPLHVPADMALTLRSPQYLDQLALIDYLARIVPHSHLIAIKEHPAMIGAISAGKLQDLLHRYDNIVLLSPSTNNYKVLNAADAVISVNSKSGAEAALLGKPIFVLGDAFYRNAPMVTAVEQLTDLPHLLSTQISEATPVRNEDEIGGYFENVWRQCYQGELYITDHGNIERFSLSILKATV